MAHRFLQRYIRLQVLEAVLESIGVLGRCSANKAFRWNRGLWPFWPKKKDCPEMDAKCDGHESSFVILHKSCGLQ